MSIIRCSKCGVAIGGYIEQDNKILIRLGQVVLSDAWGWCQCGEPWTWHSSDKKLEALIEKLKKPVDEYLKA